MKSVKTFHRFLVLVAGLELARSLERGILRYVQYHKNTIYSVLITFIKLYIVLFLLIRKSPQD